MVISDKERREVASGIRRFLSVPYDERICECDGLQTVGRLVETPVGENILARLADLIDRPTCENVSVPRGDGFTPYVEFKCSACGCSHVSLTSVYCCPRCGAEVVDDD